MIKNWRKRAETHEKMSEALAAKGDECRAQNHQLIADTFRICADELAKV